jgi:thioredoxin-dependent peroxiredoxin
VNAGDKAPDFSLTADDGTQIALKDLRGSTVVLYFYPKDDTPGCTKESCDFRDALPQFKAANAVILGVSPDSVASHARFRAKYGLPFTLLADPDHAVAERYGVWQQKKFMGKKYMGIVRTTFIIDPKGIISHVFTVKRVAGHVDEVEAALS